MLEIQTFKPLGMNVELEYIYNFTKINHFRTSSAAYKKLPTSLKYF